MVMLLVAAPVALIGSTQSNEAVATPVAQADLVSCTDVRVGQSIRIKCTAAGVIVLDETIPLPVVPGDPVTIKVPLPQETVTVRNPVPGPTQTVTEPGTNNGPTATVTIRDPAQPGETVTVRPNGGPVPTVTETTTVTPDPRQDGTEDATIDSAPEEDAAVTLPEINLSPPEAVGLGTLALLLIAGLILLGMYAGYYLGYKDSEKREAKFIRSILGR